MVSRECRPRRRPPPPSEASKKRYSVCTQIPIVQRSRSNIFGHVEKVCMYVCVKSTSEPCLILPVWGWGAGLSQRRHVHACGGCAEANNTRRCLASTHLVVNKPRGCRTVCAPPLELTVGVPWAAQPGDHGIPWMVLNYYTVVAAALLCARMLAWYVYVCTYKYAQAARNR